MLNPFGPHRDNAPAHRDPDDRTLVVPVRGDLTVANAGACYRKLRAAAKRRDVHTLVLDFGGAGRLDSSGVAVVHLLERRLQRKGKTLALRHLDPTHQAAFTMLDLERPAPAVDLDPPGLLERTGEKVLHLRARGRSFLRLVGETLREGVAVAARRARLPEGAFTRQAVTIGADALFIVGLLAFLLGMTIAFQGVVQMSKFGAQVYVADLTSLAMVRELGPMMTAIILSGRAGAAIAAELGTMRVGAEIDALATMGVSPVRFLVLPRILALTLTVPALTLLAIFIGTFGGALVASLAADLPLRTFWLRTTELVTFGDFLHGLGKSVAFAWIIGFTGTFYGLHARGDAGAVGAATTRTVVVCIVLILLVDATVATVNALRGAA